MSPFWRLEFWVSSRLVLKNLWRPEHKMYNKWNPKVQKYESELLIYSNDANCNFRTTVNILILFQLFTQRKSGVVVNFTDHDSRTKFCMYFSSSSQLSQVLSISFSPSESILPFLQALQFSMLIHNVEVAQNRIWKIAQRKYVLMQKNISINISNPSKHFFIIPNWCTQL